MEPQEFLVVDHEDADLRGAFRMTSGVWVAEPMIPLSPPKCENFTENRRGIEKCSAGGLTR